MFGRIFHSLWLRIAVPFVLFVVVGSTALVGWLHFLGLRESRGVFLGQARANAEFVRSERLPTSPRTAESLGRVLAVEVFLWRKEGWEEQLRQWSWIPGSSAEVVEILKLAHANPDKVQARKGLEAVAVEVSKDVELLMVRRVETNWRELAEPQTLGVLGAFWGLSLGLAWALARGVVHPLQLLARRLPGIEADPEGSLPGAERGDEIGVLARAYLATRSQLAQERARREEAERLAILGRMATGLAHEIHNPLGAIRMHAQLLESTPAEESAAAVRESVPVLIDETARIEGLVNQWMFLARPAPPQTSEVDLEELVKETQRVYSATAAHAGVRLEAELPGGLRVRVDRRRLGQALGNLVMNAIQAMPEGGSLRITGAKEQGWVRLHFQDEGGGFSQVALSRYAELFYSEKEGGMGIGLNVSAEIVKAHGGALRVANAPAGGAIVTLEIPSL